MVSVFAAGVVLGVAICLIVSHYQRQQFRELEHARVIAIARYEAVRAAREKVAELAPEKPRVQLR